MDPLQRWERRLRQVLERIDNHLEDTYGELYPLRPNRPGRGETANVKYDGLFTVAAKFSLGIGRPEGPGYALEVRMSTFAEIPAEVNRLIHQDVGRILAEQLPEVFPGLDLRVTWTGEVYRIHGDLSL